MFSQKEFVEASRKFVCVRLESYESEKHQEMVRSFLDGRFENTAFCLLAPDGKERLTRSGRAPWMAFRTRRGPRNGSPEDEVKSTVAEMEKVAEKYKPTGDLDQPVVPDFHSFKQSLNVASADQRLLLYVALPEEKQTELKKTLRPVFGNAKVIGRFHVDFFSAGEDSEWAKVIEGEKSTTGLFIIRSGKFGQDGMVVIQLPADAKATDIQASLLAANTKFADDEERKVYRDHVSQGRKDGVHFETNMPYGEDRDGDGKIDHRGGSRRKR